MRRGVSLSVASSAAALLVACGGGTPSDPGPVVGEWNGPHASLVLTAMAGSIEYDCAHGGFRSPAYADGRGRFTVQGVHVREHGGPMRDGEIPDSAAAEFLGQVRGNEMTLRVKVGVDTLGPFTLRRGGSKQLLKCL